ncbi:hypothetical protein BDP27DRAFT_1440294 [Rhodocollybia butyracea]|uniref:DUF6535 domain-containing protein n=1 Tax=Rhodocollybia butyracea TaxID=206335 RepID=A0A9P5P5P8_9AGAR|nr:hypothetical protein BDP27DRAFT_1440294 [Rhodocollybia butyracea]
MQAHEEREASVLRSSSDPAPVRSPLGDNISMPSSPYIQVVPVTEPTSTQQAGSYPAWEPNQPNIALRDQASDRPAGTLTGILSSLHETISDLQHAVTGSKKRVEKGTKDRPFKVRPFGLKKDQATQGISEEKYDYALKYPEDEYYHELDEEARIWRVYGDEASAFDNDMVGELSDSLDILLVFAGLFSAVLTTFVAQTSQSLSQDNTQLSASYLSELTMLVRANGNSTAILNIPLTSTSFSPDILDLWINGLWFTSLVISLSVALFAVLAKQWLRQYMSIITGTPEDQAYIRQFRFDGLEKWQVQPLIGMLPTFLHLALILFLAGLVIFLLPLSTTMAYVVGAISVTVVVLYLTATVLPLFTVQCSYRTTLTHLLYSAIYTMITLAHDWVWKQPNGSEDSDSSMPDTLKEGERFVACRREDQDLDSLAWLSHYTSNPSARSVLFWSLGALSPWRSEKVVEVMYPFFASHIKTMHRQTWENLDELESWFRAAIHFVPKILGVLSLDQSYNEFQVELHRMYENQISDHHCDITSALSALAFGISPVKFFHAGHCIELAAENAIDWIFDTYEEGPPDIPLLVWEPLLQKSSYDEEALQVVRRYLLDRDPETRDLVIFERARLGLRPRTPLPNS